MWSSPNKGEAMITIILVGGAFYLGMRAERGNWKSYIITDHEET